MVKSVLITGSSRGTGAAAVCRFAEAGYAVAFTYRRSEAQARQLAAETGALAICANAVSPEATAATMARAIERHRGIDVLINNAGVAQYGLLADAQDADYRSVMDVNLFGTFCAIRAVIPHMSARGCGCIINVFSLRGEQGAVNEALYCISKSAIIGLTRAAAKELARDGIRVNCVSPRPMRTDMNACRAHAESKRLAPRRRKAACNLPRRRRKRCCSLPATRPWKLQAGYCPSTATGSVENKGGHGAK